MYPLLFPRDLRPHWNAVQPPRVYSFLLGMVQNYECDREAARSLCRVAPWIRSAAIINHDFAVRSVLTSLALGVRQFLDLGCGLPTWRNVHEVDRRRQYTTVYVDRDPEVFAHARTYLEDSPSETAVYADLLAMEQLLACEAVRSAFDPGAPVAVLLHDVLPWCTDDAAVHQALAVLRAWMPAGSTLSITHLTDHWHRATMPDVERAYADHGLRIRPRSREAIAALFGDFVQQRRGLAAVGRWHSESRHARSPEENSAAFAGIAVKPGPSDRRLPAAERGRGGETAPITPLRPLRRAQPPRPPAPGLFPRFLMCQHQPACPPATAPDWEAAQPLAHHAEQAWSLLCNGVLLFEDTGALLPDGRIIAPHRPLATA
ncbi:hypothetical protein GCM10010371_67390 [Streptomyces subrutilus]|uniref:S-adenosyl methyltransferase n=1 Tax=Streptomyces subrutilus TaxID=36818 RepID=A0A5P2UZT4_9ACTN|nr:DUF5999 family protein [Streptomyces subrutilus]QEU82287.1 hypothetical protein CP968_32035 [Streptomyces subrutilus]GGZ98170.1 hypothetical protein GCM10010371_67390 [Streptomyces subrutilus]